MGDRNKKQYGNAKRQQPETLAVKPFKSLKGFKVGPVCLACNEVIDLRRQSTGNGYVHSACEPKKGQAPKFYVLKDGEDDLVLVRAEAAQEVA